MKVKCQQALKIEEKKNNNLFLSVEESVIASAEVSKSQACTSEASAIH